MLTVENINKTYGQKTVLHDVSFALAKHTVTGLVGPNGVGKSTLFRIIAEQETADFGKVSIGHGEKTGYLSQSMEINPGETVGNLIDKAFREVQRIKSRMEEIELRMSDAVETDLALLTEEYAKAVGEFEYRGGYDLDWKREAVFEGLGVRDIETNRLAGSLSGGEKTRLNLALMLLEDPDILLLDEPTNNLDMKCLVWLERYLSSYKGAVIIASHDRRFLNDTVTRIFEIDEHTHELTEYPGDYDDFKRVKNDKRIKWKREYEEQQAEIRELNRLLKTTVSPSKRKSKTRDNDKFVINFKTERTQQLASRNIRSAKERLDRINESPVPKPPKQMTFKAESMNGEIRSDVVMRVEGLSKRYNGRVILRDVSLAMRHDSRIVITGPNGTGKTTLFRLLTAEEQPDSGSIKYPAAVKIGYLRQEPGSIDNNKTVLDDFRQGRNGHEDEFIFSLVTTGLFGYDDIRKPINQLSLGQKRKLEIARLIADEPNVLLLDEPTNHISLDIIEEFESAIVVFRGPVLAVSHDREFIRRFAEDVYQLEKGVLVKADMTYF